MADRVHPTPPPPRADQQTTDATSTTAAETTPLQQQQHHHQSPSFNRAPAPAPGTYIVHVPRDQVLRVPPPDRARRYKKLAARPARRHRLRRACCLSCCALLLLLLAAAPFVGAVYLVFRPRAPSFSVTSLSVRGLLDAAAPPQNSSSSSLELVAAVRADNAANRKVSIDYRGGGAVAVSYSGARLAAGPWPAFRQPPRNVTVLSLALTGGGGVAALTDEQRRRIAADLAAGAVPLAVEATVRVRLRFGKVLRTWTVDVRAECEVAVDRLDGTPAAAVDRGCSVRVKPLWWWW